jgi:hypothetical protein
LSALRRTRINDEGAWIRGGKRRGHSSTAAPNQSKHPPRGRSPTATPIPIAGQPPASDAQPYWCPGAGRNDRIQRDTAGDPGRRERRGCNSRRGHIEHAARSCQTSKSTTPTTARKGRVLRSLRCWRHPQRTCPYDPVARRPGVALGALSVGVQGRPVRSSI